MASRSSFRWVRWLVLALGVGVLLALHLAGLDDRFWPYLKSNHALLLEAVDQRFVLALLMFFVIYVVVIGLSIPISVLFGLAAGALFGRVMGTVLISFAATSGATAAFLVSRYLLGDLVRQRLGARLNALDQGVARDGAYYLLTLRLLPVVPFVLINLGMGVTRMRLRTYWWATQLGMLPANVLFVNAGTELGKMESPRGVLDPSVIISLVLLGLFPLAVRLVLRRPVTS